MFKKIEDYNYEVSCSGEVRNIRTKRLLSQRKKKNGRKNGSDRYCVYLSKNGKSTEYTVARLVGIYFVPNDNPSLKTQINHLDGDTSNNNMTNLEWVTPAQNQRHAYSESLKTTRISHKDEIVISICEYLQKGYRIVDIPELVGEGVSKEFVRSVKRGKSGSNISKNYQFTYKNSNTLSTSTLKWIWNKILKGLGDKEISELANNSKITETMVKQVRNGNKYKHIRKD